MNDDNTRMYLVYVVPNTVANRIGTYIYIGTYYVLYSY